ncbi:MAG: beta-ketoacyl-ACP synthase II [Candidatus Eremiobacteraeota bacterium]|nr:beta-ketoacyl-ACP synthase II [Candidatus Eremiobacteraeota bacterium]MBV8331706.1 beta-ketoacyl-ACP synthase II [Candidatus Eremiobacteraeota bacterium]
MSASSTPAPSRRRVVVTGLGAVTPIGNTREEFWRRTVAGESGIAPITAFDASLFTTRIAGEVKDFRPDELLGRKEARRLDRFSQFAIVAGREAIEDAKLPDDAECKRRTGAVVGTGIGGIITFWLNSEKANENGTWSKVTPFFIPMLMSNAAPAHISMSYGFQGPVFATGSACASANDAICVAYNYVAYGDADAMITGGSEATVSPLAIGGFCSMKAMSTRNDDPTRASRPFDKERDGFVLGEGAGILVLEEYERAKARNAKIYCEILGYGQSADAFDLVAPDPDGNGVRLAFERAFASAGVTPQEVDYVNAHGTSTPIGDPAESRAIEKAFGDRAAHIGVSSTKSMHGHALGAAGGIEGVLTAMAVHDDVMPPTINYEYPDPECTLDYVPNVARRAPVRVAFSNSFGFGGHNSVIVFGKVR